MSPCPFSRPSQSAPPGQAKDKVEKATITLYGTIDASTNADGETSYTLADGGKTYTLDAGPRWFFGDNYPLNPYVGRRVTVVGEVAEGSTDVDVISVDGIAAPGARQAARGPGVGVARLESHPGWSQDKADRMKAKFGDCFPPGQCKDKAEQGRRRAGRSPKRPSGCGCQIRAAAPGTRPIRAASPPILGR